MVRYFCVVGPTGMAISDLGYRYLRDMVDQRVRVRALPIGASGAFCTEKRWYELGTAFTRPMSLPFVNVVCGPCGQLLGAKAPASTFASAEALPAELRGVLGGMPGSKSADVDYEPQTVLAGLYTVGVKNVAIVSGSPDDHELAALAQYDLVVVPDPADQAALEARGLAVTSTSDFVGALEESCGISLADPTPTPMPEVEPTKVVMRVDPGYRLSDRPLAVRTPGIGSLLVRLWRSLLSLVRRRKI